MGSDERGKEESEQTGVEFPGAASDDTYEAGDLPDPPRLWLEHYPRVLKAYWRRKEDGLADLEQALRAKAAAQPGGKFGKNQVMYVPFVPLPPLDWRHKCGHCRFWVDESPNDPGECMIVGRDGDRWGGKAIHEEAGCALFMPPAGEPAFAWIREQARPTGADLVRGEYHPQPEFTDIPVSDEREGGQTQERETTDGTGSLSQRHTTERAVGDTYIPAGTHIGLEPVIEGLAAPVEFVTDPRERSRRFVADQRGYVYVYANGSLREEPLLDLTDRVVDLESQYDERGLLGLAVHPAFADNGRLFIRYSAPPRAGTPAAYDHTEVLAEFRVDESLSPISPDSEETIMELPSPAFNHNAGAVEFGPDGYLYVATGDGGGEGDQGLGHVEGGNGQDLTENLLGGILRIDVDDKGDEESYAIPEDNPLGDRDGLDEYYAWGLRNPWRISFDSDGRLFVGDVGQHLFEEVNIVERGGNYGWNVREGFHCFDPENPTHSPEDCPEESERGEPLRDPILEYPHVHGEQVIGSAVIGGAVYEGATISELRGAYVFGDWAVSQDRPSGRLFAARPPDGNDRSGANNGSESQSRDWSEDRRGAETPSRWSIEELVVAGSENGRPNRNILGFASDPDGELYVLSSETHVPKGKTGAIHRIIQPESKE